MKLHHTKNRKSGLTAIKVLITVFVLFFITLS